MSLRKASVRSVPPGELNGILTDLKRAIEFFDSSYLSREEMIRAKIIAQSGGAIVPGDAIGTAPGEVAEVVYTTPPAPTNVAVTSVFSVIMVEFDLALYPGHAYAEILRSGTSDLGDAVVIGQTVQGPYVDRVGTGSPDYWYWVRFVNGASPAQTGPVNSQIGTQGKTVVDPAYVLSLLNGQITSSQLSESLATPISQIGGIVSGLAQEVIDRVQGDAAEALDRANALAQEQSDRAAAIAQEQADRAAQILAETGQRQAAILAESNNRVSQISAVDAAIRADLATADQAVVTLLQSQVASGDAATLASAQNYSYSKAQTDSAIAAQGSLLQAAFTAADAVALASAQNFTYSRAAIDSADAATLATLRSEFAAADATTLASAQSYTFSQAQINSAIASSSDTLRAQITGGSSSTSLGSITSGLIHQVNTASVSRDDALAQQLTLLSAGAGEQFDYTNIWYFDANVEGWAPNIATSTTMSAVNGWLRMVASTGTQTGRMFQSPAALAINGAKYPQVKLRVRKVGTPTWVGRLYFTTTTDAVWDTIKSVLEAEPTYDGNGIGLLTFNMPAGWTNATIAQVRFEASTNITVANYFELDWAAIGRPSPGASSAQLTELQTATAQTNAALASDITTLTGNLTTLTGTVATKAAASALTALETRVTATEGVNTSQGSSITSLNNSLTTLTGTVNTKADASALTALDTRVTAAEGVNTSQGSSITTLQNSVTALGTSKADASAVNALTTRVTAAEGVNTSQGTSITSLNNSVSTINGTLATKADASALTTLANTVTAQGGTIASQGSAVTAVEAKITGLLEAPNDSLTADQGMSLAAAWRSHYGHDLAPRFTTVADGAATLTVCRSPTPIVAFWNYSRTKVIIDPSRRYRIKARIKRYGSNGPHYFTWWRNTQNSYGNVSIPLSEMPDGVWSIVQREYLGSAFLDTDISPGFSLNHTGATTGYSEIDWFSFTDITDEAANTANASALTALDARVTSAEGVNTSQGSAITSLNNSLSTLTTTVATKADASALTSLTTRVTAAEGVNTSQGNSITTLNNSLTTLTGTVNSKASAAALSALDSRVTTVEGATTSQGASITSLSNSLTTTNTNVTNAQAAATAAATLAGSKGKVLVQTAAPAAGDQLAQNLWIDITGGANTPKRWNGSAWVAVTDKVATDAAAAAANALTVANTKADASAVTSLTTRVTNIEGVNTAQATSITGLQSSVTTATTNAAAAQTTANSAVTAAAAAQSTANTATTSAATANTLLADIASDTKLTPVEKSAVRSEWDVIAAEKAANNAQAAAFAITTENTAYNTAFQALATYLNAGTAWASGVPSLVADANLGTTTTIVGATFRSNFSAYYAARTALLNAIASKAKTLADAAQTTANAANALAATKADATALTTTNTNVSNLSGTLTAQAGQITTLQSRIERGSSLTPRLEDWKNLAGHNIVTIADGKVGDKALRLTNVVSTPNSGVMVPIDRTKTYRVRFWARPSPDTTGTLYHALQQFQDAAGTLVGPVNSGLSPYKPANFTRAQHNTLFGGTDQWGEYSYLWTVADWQAGVTHVRSTFLRNYPGGSGVVGHWDIQDYEFKEVTQLESLSASLQIEATTRATQTGDLYAQYTVKTDVGGLISGYGLASTAVNAAPTSAFGVQAGQFFVAPPAVAAATAPTVGLFKGYTWRDTTTNTTKYWTGSAWSTTPQTLPFVVQTTPQVINGFTVEPGIYGDAAFFARLVATRGQIGLLSVDDARIASVSVEKLVAGSIAVGQYIQSTGYVPGSAGWRINGDGSGEMRSLVVRGDVQATSLNAATGTFSGTLTASAINAVNTINIADQAVTIPVSDRVGRNIDSFGAPVYTDVVVNTVSVVSSGAPAYVFANGLFKTAGGTGFVKFDLMVDGIVYADYYVYHTASNGNPVPVVLTTVMTLTPGAHTITVRYFEFNVAQQFRIGTSTVLYLEIKK